ncbi:beta-secretase 1-like [Ostrinia furnacalis]|uniref:beta-secretase 1-like n=1 Tax=Ostrinia furnacalis TaxID=93504 RepID=UPI0010400CAF|nr:beta-secretase 1-like [Ostrinia furnacalis]
MKLFFLFKIILWFCSIRAEEYNLSGDAGQAYSIDILMGHPKQKLRVIVDTGSTTLAIASYARRENDEYFHVDNSTTLDDSGKEVQAKYSQGNWIGHYVTDFVEIPSLKNIREVRSDFAIITKSHKFFVNGSGWQGLLGLAYEPVGAWGEHVIVGSWLDSLECDLGKSVSFELKLCGVQSTTNATHYGKFSMIVDENIPNNTSPFRTPILHKRWYEVGVLAIGIRHPNETLNNSITPDTFVSDNPNEEMCQKLNQQKSIVDSGTTDIRLPDEVYRELVHKLRQESQALNMLILDEFWYHGEAACWPEPQEWLALPWLQIALLSDVADNQYFTLEIPPQNYMRVVTARNSSGDGGSVSQFCYKLGLEAGGVDTVLGYTAMEGLKVLFNRSGGWIGFETSSCGPNARVSGPYTVPYSFIDSCKLTRSDSETAVSIKAAQWALCVISIVAGFVLIYLLAPAVRMCILRRRQSSAHSVSQDALVDQELS